MAMKLRNKARSLEDGVDDGGKHCWHVSDQGLAKIYDSSLCFCSIPLCCRHGSYGVGCPF